MYSEEDKFRLEVAQRIANAKSGSEIIVIIDDGEEFGVDGYVTGDTPQRELQVLDDARFIVRQDQEVEVNRGESA